MLNTRCEFQRTVRWMASFYAPKGVMLIPQCAVSCLSFSLILLSPSDLRIYDIRIFSLCVVGDSSGLPSMVLLVVSRVVPSHTLVELPPPLRKHHLCASTEGRVRF